MTSDVPTPPPSVPDPTPAPPTGAPPATSPGGAFPPGSPGSPDAPPPRSTVRSAISGAPAWMQGLAAVGTLVISVLVALRLIPDTPLNPSNPDPSAVASVIQGSVEEELARSVVQVQMMSGGEMVGWGSGTVISDDGLILTNAHVATPDDVELDDLVIAVTDAADTPPEERYHAEVVAADAVLDLAVIRMTETMGGGPYDGALEPIPIGDSDEVGIGDEIIILGYPSVGGDTITLTYGRVSGFTANPTLGSHAWIKTDATILGGNSGGLAANTAGEIIGVPTQLGAGDTGEIVDCRVVTDTNRDGVINDEDECIPLGGFLNSLRPVNLLVDMLAAIEAGVAYEPIGGLPDPADDPDPGPAGFDPTEVSFGRPVFLDEQPPEGEFTPSADPVWLESGATALCAWWEYSGMKDGARYSAVWGLDGELQESVSYIDELWIGGESGSWWVCITNSEGVPDGMWDLELSVEDTFITGSFVALGGPEPVTLTVSNDGPETICYLQVSPTTSTFWGADWLGAEQTIPPNEGVTLDLPPATYDLRGLDCNVEELFVDQQEITADTTLTY